MSHRILPAVLGRSLCLVLFTASLAGQDRLTPTTLTTWNASGASPVVEAATGAITLPAGSQLLRSYPAGRVGVRLRSRPYFLATSGNWPALEVGPAALTFVQDGGGGGVVLLGDKILTLPKAIPLGADGRSAEPLDLSLEYDPARNEAILVLEGISHRIVATAVDKDVVVAVSAGGESAWSLDLLEVNPSVSSGEPGARRGNGATGGQKKSPRSINPAADAPGRKQAFADASSLFKAKDYARAEERLLRSNRQEPGTLGWYLESAGKLTHMALGLRRQFDHRGAIIVAQRAQALLLDAEKLARKSNEAGQRATILEMKAYLADELLRDPAAARADYDQAKRMDAGSVRASQGLQRLDEAESKAERVGRKP